MAIKVDLQPIQEEHITALCSFLKSVGVGSKIDPDKDFVREDAKRLFSGGENFRQKYIKIEDMNIDWIGYQIYQERNSEGGWIKNWAAVFQYYVERTIGTDKKALKEIGTQTETKSKGFFKKEIVDFRWVGGRLADVLNQDTSLKEPLLAGLIAAQTTKSIPSIFISPITPPSDKEIKEQIKELSEAGINLTESDLIRKMPIQQGVAIFGSGIRGKKNEIKPLFIPSKEALRAYDSIARHIKEYVIV
jgi:hypothetical protein